MIRPPAVATWAAVLSAVAAPAVAAEPTVIPLWPGKPPGETKELPPEQDINKPTDKLIGGRKIIKLANVSAPTLSVFRPAKDKDTGAAVIICPGGGHHILAFDHEGTEVAEWLNTLGVTGIVLKYRVPARDKNRKWSAAVADAQRAVSLVRSKAGEWGIDPKRIGILGFSAGGQTAALTTLFLDDRQYPAADDIDKVSSRPDFTVLIYPWDLVEKAEPRLQPHVRVAKECPPMFLVHAFDDGVTVNNSLVLALEARKAGVPCELHVYSTGGHGFGIRPVGGPVADWPKRCEEWLRKSGYVK